MSFNNHSNEKVPDIETVSGIRIATIIVGVAIALPAFLVGSEVIYSLGAIKGSLAILAGGGILTVIATLTMMVGAKSRLSTYNIAQFPFGRLGAKFVNLVLSMTLFGWFGVTAHLFGAACTEAVVKIFFITVPVWIFTLLGGLLMVTTTIFGFRAIDNLSRLSVPLLLLVLLSSVYQLLSQISIQELIAVPGKGGTLINFGVAVSAVAGSFMVGATIISDISRFSRHTRDSIIGSLFSFGSFLLLILISAGLPSLATGNKDLISNFYHVGLGMPALFIVVFATWTTNTNNLYSASLGIAQIFPDKPDWLITSLSGLFGVALAIIGIIKYFVSFLLLLGIAIPPIAGIYLVDFYLLRKQHYDKAMLEQQSAVRWQGFLAWLSGTIVGGMTYSGVITLTTVPACDALFVASIIYLAVNIRERQALGMQAQTETMS